MLGTEDVAKPYGVTCATVPRWFRRGNLPGAQRLGTGQRPARAMPESAFDGFGPPDPGRSTGCHLSRSRVVGPLYGCQTARDDRRHGARRAQMTTRAGPLCQHRRRARMRRAIGAAACELHPTLSQIPAVRNAWQA